MLVVDGVDVKDGRCH